MYLTHFLCHYTFTEKDLYYFYSRSLDIFRYPKKFSVSMDIKIAHSLLIKTSNEVHTGAYHACTLSLNPVTFIFIPNYICCVLLIDSHQYLLDAIGTCRCLWLKPAAVTLLFFLIYICSAKNCT